MRAIALSCLLLLSAAASAASKPTTAPATTKPSVRPKAVKPPDLLKGAVDPYEPAAERGRFFRAAGVDNELDAKEFTATRGQEDSFVRRFDNLEMMRGFDKDRNRQLDWFEADAYRQEVRRRVLKAFDANGDGRLTGKERDKANAQLATGRIPGDGSARPASPRGASGEVPDWMRQRMLRQRQDLQRRFDADRDGKLEGDERKAMLAAVRKEAEEEMESFRERRFDTDGDGELSEEERRFMEEVLATQKRQAEQWQRDRDMRLYDVDGDGELSEEEVARMAQDKARRETQGRDWESQWEARQYDVNRDGEIDEEERMLVEAARARRDVYQKERFRGPNPREREQWEARVREWRMRHFDENDDGQMSEAEQAEARAFERELQGIGRQMRVRMADADGDGEVSREEREAMQAQWRQAGWKVFTRTFRYMDADGNGQISYGERQEFQRRIRAGMVGYIERWTERHDADRNGRLNPRERRVLLEAAHRDFADRVARHDTNRDGRISVDEAIELMEGFAQEIGIRPVAPRDAAPPDRPDQRPE